jgi:hypothetical protein
MNSYKSFIFFITLMSIALCLNAQESEPMSDMSDTTSAVTEPIDEQQSDDSSTQLLTESSNDITTDDSNDITTDDSSDITTDGSTDIPIDDSTDLSTIEIIVAESQYSDSLNVSESMEESNETNPLNVITSEYNGLDYEQSSNSSEFSCYGRSFGQYADVAKDCRVFHLCYPFFNQSNDELFYQRITFLCDEESVFDQKHFICVDKSILGHECSDSPLFYATSNQEYLIKVFSQNVSPIDAVNGESKTVTEESTSSPNWFNWLYGN